jgi:hypothetical protein
MTTTFGGHRGFIVLRPKMNGYEICGWHIHFKPTIFKTIRNARAEARSYAWRSEHDVGVVLSFNPDLLEIVPDETLPPHHYHQQELELAEREIVKWTERYNALVKGPPVRPEFATKASPPRSRRLVVDEDE